MTTGIDIFFSKLFECKSCLEISLIYSKDFRLSTSAAVEESLKELSSVVNEMYEGYTAIYYAPKVRIDKGEVVEIKLYVRNMYDVIQNAYLLFTDSWIRECLDRLSLIIARLIYKLNYRQ